MYIPFKKGSKGELQGESTTQVNSKHTEHQRANPTESWYKKTAFLYHKCNFITAPTGPWAELTGI